VVVVCWQDVAQLLKSKAGSDGARQASMQESLQQLTENVSKLRALLDEARGSA
jgi:hypothetical protein